jgi:hypothetical protein
MLKDAAYSAELEAMRRASHDTSHPDITSTAPGPPGSEEDSQVSTSEALDMLRQVRIS